MAGLAAARARGTTGGRPTVWTDDKLRAALAMHASGTQSHRSGEMFDASAPIT